MQNKRFIWTAAAVAVVMTSWLAWPAFFAPMPEEWRRLRIGMSRNEVAATVRDPINDMREMKGFDAVTHTPFAVVRGYRWSLTIRYDERGRVAELWVCTSNDVSGVFDRPPKRLAG